MIDVDPQGNSTSGVGIDKTTLKYSTYDIFINNVNPAQVIMDTIVDGLSIIPSNIDLVGAEVELVAKIAREQILKQALKGIRKNYDFIFMDCPPSLGLITVNALTAADKILVPIQCEYYAT